MYKFISEILGKISKQNILLKALYIKVNIRKNRNS